uniref:Probable G-protein coupled receptor 83-like n=1 Tax=Saccoglossus kowalevskii TaxID=10224 RepID=A0ABM0M166_SACKO|nr:PREDICTED: probable G-protein coupled receptor 83-like [Saccoglossus kowalevskii]
MGLQKLCLEFGQGKNVRLIPVHDLSIYPPVLDEHDISIIQMYMSSPDASVDKASFDMFARKQRSFDATPPTKASLIQHIKLVVSEAVSIFTLTAIGIDRYYVVMYPLRPRTDNRKKKIIILVTWILATGLSAPKPWVLQLYSYPLVDGKTAHSCSPNWPSIEHKHRYDWALVIILFALPLVLLSFCYGRVARKLWLRSLPGNADPERDREQKKSKEKTVKMLISVVVLFALCWLPLNVYNIVLSYYPEYFRSHQQETRISRASVLIWLTLSDTIINPIVYVFLSDRFRKDLKNMFYQWTRRCRSDGDDFYTGGYATTSAYDTSPYTTRRTRLSPNMSSTDMGRNTNMDNTLDVSSNRNITLTVDGLPKKRSIVAGSKV